jgi:hypothetical protein
MFWASGTMFESRLKRLRTVSQWWTHRNLGTRASKFALVQQTFWAKKKLAKSLLISTLDKVIYYIGKFLQGSTKPLFTTQKRLETSWNKSPFFNMLLLVLRFLWMNRLAMNLYVARPFWTLFLGNNRCLKTGTQKEATKRERLFYEMIFIVNYISTKCTA